MAVRAIRITGDPVLHTRATEVTDFDDELRELIDDMFETMREAPGVGLAAPQVGVPLRVFVYHWTDDDGVLWHGAAVNPELWITPVPTGEPDEDDESEGCLSIPGERFGLRRAERAILKAVDANGAAFELEAEGWLARIFQHEYDHLNGTLYADRLRYKDGRQLEKIIRKRWGGSDESWMPGKEHLEE